MADYVVRTRYVTEGLKDTANDANAAFSALDKLGGLLGTIKMALAAVAGAMVFGKVAREVISLGSAAEDTRIAIAAMMQAGGAAGLSKSTEDFNTALGMSDEIIQRMRKHARDLPGEFEDLMQVFRGVMSPSMAGGKSIAEIEKFSARMMAVAATLQVPSAIAGHELGAILQGATRSNMPMWQRLHPFLDEKDVKNWKELSEAQRFEKVLKATEGFAPAIQKFATTWTAISSATSDYGKEVTRAFGAPIFEGFKQALSEINDWYMLHRTQILGLAQLLSSTLVGAVHKAVEATRGLVTTLGPALRSFGGSIGINRERAVTLGAGAVGLAAGAPGLGLLVGGFIEFTKHSGEVGVALGALKDIFDTAVVAIGPGLHLMSIVMSAIGELLAAVLPPLLWGLAHGLHYLFAGLAAFTDVAGELIQRLMKTLAPLLTTLGAMFRSVFQALGATLGGVLGILAYFLKQAMPTIDGFVWVLAWLMGWLAKLATAIADMVTWLFKKVPGLQKEGGGSEWGGADATPERSWLDNLMAELPKMGASFDRYKQLLDKAGPAKGQHNTNITNNNHVTQYVSQADAPRRLLIATRRVLEQAIDHPIEGAYSYGTSLR